VYEHERAHPPDSAWPHTSWHSDSVGGDDRFAVEREDCPIVMRWLGCEKTD